MGALTLLLWCAAAPALADQQPAVPGDPAGVPRAALPPAALPPAAPPPAAASPGPAATDPRTAESINRRQLAGHTYIPLRLIRDPFIVTSFGSYTGLGYNSFAGAYDPGDGSGTQQIDLQLLAYAQTFTFQAAVNEHWLLRFSLNGSSATPLNIDTIYNSFSYALQLSAVVGTLVAFQPAQRVRLGVAVDFQYTPTGTLDLAGPIRYAVQYFQQSGQQPTYEQFVSVLLSSPNKLLRLQGLFTLPLTATAAVTVHRSLGLLANLGYSFGYGTDFLTGAAATTHAVSMGTGVSFDLGALSPVKLGLLGGYLLNIPVSPSLLLEHQITAGLFYTGRPHLALGLENVFALRQPAPDLRSVTYEGDIVLRYFW